MVSKVPNENIYALTSLSSISGDNNKNVFQTPKTDVLHSQQVFKFKLRSKYKCNLKIECQVEPSGSLE